MYKTSCQDYLRFYNYLNSSHWTRIKHQSWLHCLENFHIRIKYHLLNTYSMPDTEIGNWWKLSFILFTTLRVPSASYYWWVNWGPERWRECLTFFMEGCKGNPFPQIYFFHAPLSLTMPLPIPTLEYGKRYVCACRKREKDRVIQHVKGWQGRGRTVVAGKNSQFHAVAIRGKGIFSFSSCYKPELWYKFLNIWWGTSVSSTGSR